MAEIGWAPVESADAPLSVQLATPALIATFVQAPIKTPLSRNDVVPVGVPTPGALAEKVTVNVTALEKADGVPLVTSTAALLALLTLCVRAALALLARKLVSPS